MDDLFKTVPLWPFLITHTSFISPAIVSPEIVDVDIPKDDSGRMRRGLMVIAKVIQNLAHDNIVNVTRYLSEVNVSLFFSLLVALLFN